MSCTNILMGGNRKPLKAKPFFEKSATVNELSQKRQEIKSTNFLKYFGL